MEYLRILMLSTTLIQPVDGDTVRLAESGQGVRLQGFNTPETYAPKCPEEKALGLRAKTRLVELLKKPDVQLRINGGSCAYGRACGTITVAGVDVGTTLINEGLAEPMICHGSACPPARDWCAYLKK
jgi:micrococcal nuclease